MLDEKFQLRIMPMQKQHIFKYIIAGIHAEKNNIRKDNGCRNVFSDRQ